jgi:hypothetical protein
MKPADFSDVTSCNPVQIDDVSEDRTASVFGVEE